MLKITICITILLSFSFEAFGQRASRRPIRVTENEKDRFKRLKYECYLRESSERKSYEKCKKIYTGIIKTGKDIDKVNWKDYLAKMMGIFPYDQKT